MEIKKYSIIPVIGLLLLLFACEEEQLSEIGNPELSVKIPETAPAFAYPGKPIAFSVDIEAKAGIDKVLTKVGFDQLAGTEETGFENTMATYAFSYVPEEEEIGQTLEFIIVAYDKAGFTATSSYKVDIVAEPVIVNFIPPEGLPDTLEVGDTLDFDILITSEDELATIETLYGDMVLEGLTMSEFENGFSANYHFEYILKAEDGGKNAVFTFKVTDIEGKSKQWEYTVYIVGERAPLPLVLRENITLGFQGNTSTGQFMDLEGNTVYTVPEAKENSAKVDLGVFRSGGSSGINIFAPTFGNAATYIYNSTNWGEDNMGSWPTRNNTAFINLTPDHMSVEEFQALSDDGLIAEIIEENATANNIANIAIDQLIGFKTVDGVYGVIHVKAFVEASDGTFTFDYKISE